MKSPDASILDPASPVRPWVRRLSMAIGLIVLLLIGAHWWWGHAVEQRLTERVAALRRAGEPVMPEDFLRPPLPDDHNAAHAFRAAAALIERRDDRWRRLRRIDVYSPLDLSAVAALREVNDLHQESLSLAAEAAERRDADWGVRLDVFPPDQDLPDLQPARDLSRLLLAAAAVAQAAGDDQAMLQRLRQVLALGVAIDQQPRALAHAVAIEIISSAGDFAVSRAPYLRLKRGKDDPAREELKALISRLVNGAPQWEAQRRALLGERAMHLHTIRGRLAGTMRVTSAPAAAQEPAGSPLLRYGLKPLLLQDALLLLNHTERLARAMDESGNWPAFQQAAPRVPEAVAQRSPGHPAADALFGFDDRALQGQFRGLTDRLLAATALAIQLYRADHNGALPPALDDLVPAYLPSLPNDPLAPGGPLRYRRGDLNAQDPLARPAVYSVGRDGADDGGSDAPRIPGGFRDRWNAKDAVVYLLPAPPAAD